MSNQFWKTSKWHLHFRILKKSSCRFPLVSLHFSLYVAYFWQHISKIHLVVKKHNNDSLWRLRSRSPTKIEKGLFFTHTKCSPKFTCRNEISETQIRLVFGCQVCRCLVSFISAPDKCLVVYCVVGEWQQCGTVGGCRNDGTICVVFYCRRIFLGVVWLWWWWNDRWKCTCN